MKKLLLILLLLPACAPSPESLTEQVVRVHCSREYRCCSEDKRRYQTTEQCIEDTAKLFPHGVHTDRALAYIELKQDCASKSDNGLYRRHLFAALAKSAPVIVKVGYACKTDAQCPALYDEDYKWLGQSTCSCPFNNIDPQTGRCNIARTCVAPAKRLERCSHHRHRIVCDGDTWCSMAEGSKFGKCVERSKKGERCKNQGMCAHGLHCVNGKCENAGFYCYL